jgi:hypothetical protein
MDYSKILGLGNTLFLVHFIIILNIGDRINWSNKFYLNNSVINVQVYLLKIWIYFCCWYSKFHSTADEVTMSEVLDNAYSAKQSFV